MANGAAMEEALTSLWCQVLRATRVDRDDDFFALGGDSIAASRLLARLQQAHGRNFPLDIVFDYPTIRTMASHLKGLLAPKA